MDIDLKEDMLTMLKDLAQLDIDAAAAYEQALEKIDDKEIYKNIDNFRHDHLRHIDDLNEVIVKHGGEVVEMEQDFKGFVIEGFTALRSITGMHGALKAMEGNEKTTNKNYGQALKDSAGFPENVISLLEKNYNDEKRHLEYIQQTLQRLNNK